MGEGEGVRRVIGRRKEGESKGGGLGKIEGLTEGLK